MMGRLLRTDLLAKDRSAVTRVIEILPAVTEIGDKCDVLDSWFSITPMIILYNLPT